MLTLIFLGVGFFVGRKVRQLRDSGAFAKANWLLIVFLFGLLLYMGISLWYIWE